jgi:hypothetical protein
VFSVGETENDKRMVIFHAQPTCVVFDADLPGDVILRWVRTNGVPRQWFDQIADSVALALGATSMARMTEQKIVALVLPKGTDIVQLQQRLIRQLPNTLCAEVRCVDQIPQLILSCRPVPEGAQ